MHRIYVSVSIPLKKQNHFKWYSFWNDGTWWRYLHKTIGLDIIIDLPDQQLRKGVGLGRGWAEIHNKTHKDKVGSYLIISNVDVMDIIPEKLTFSPQNS